MQTCYLILQSVVLQSVFYFILLLAGLGEVTKPEHGSVGFVISFLSCLFLKYSPSSSLCNCS